MSHKPSDFATTYPWSSVARKSEVERIALNILKILKRTGDEWRELSWEEYKTIRLADEAAAKAENPKYRINFAEYLERPAFEVAVPYTTSVLRVCAFSDSWKAIVAPIRIEITMWGVNNQWKGFLHTGNTPPMGIGVHGTGRTFLRGGRRSMLEGIVLSLPYVKYNIAPEDNAWQPGGSEWQRVVIIE